MRGSIQVAQITIHFNTANDLISLILLGNLLQSAAAEYWKVDWPIDVLSLFRYSIASRGSVKTVGQVWVRTSNFATPEAARGEDLFKE